ncbi:unnamed protein product, partial [Phaeothamnion confervicola]
MLQKRAQLPAFQMADDIIGQIERNQVVVVSGETGCGKTVSAAIVTTPHIHLSSVAWASATTATQVPQLVLDRLIEQGRGARANILVTQPRRISAIGVAERIAAERCERAGQTAGYQIRLESKRSRQTRLLLCTTGVLLRRLQIDPVLATVSHVFVDEVRQ